MLYPDSFGNAIGDGIVAEQQQIGITAQEEQQMESELTAGTSAKLAQDGPQINQGNTAMLAQENAQTATAAGSLPRAQDAPLTNNPPPPDLQSQLPEVVISATRLPPTPTSDAQTSLFDSIYMTSERSTTSQAPQLLAYNAYDQKTPYAYSPTTTPLREYYDKNGTLHITDLVAAPNAEPAWVEAASQAQLFPITLPDGTIIQTATLVRQDGAIVGGTMDVTSASDVAGQEAEINTRKSMIAADQAEIDQLTADQSSTPPPPPLPSMFLMGGKLGASFDGKNFGVEPTVDLFPFNVNLQLNFGSPKDSYEFSLNNEGDVGASLYGLGGDSGGGLTLDNVSVSPKGMISATLPDLSFNAYGVSGAASPELGVNPIGIAMRLPNVTEVMQEGVMVGKLLTDQPQIEALKEQVQALQSSVQALEATPLPVTTYNVVPPNAS